MRPHGNKIYVQTLLHPNRAVLFKQYMADNRINSASEALRQLLYAQLEDLYPNWYRETEFADRLNDKRDKRRKARGPREGADEEF